VMIFLPKLFLALKDIILFYTFYGSLILTVF